MGRRDLRRRIDLPQRARRGAPPDRRERRFGTRGRLIGLGLTRADEAEHPQRWEGPLGPGEARVQREDGAWQITVEVTALPGGLRIGSEAEITGLRRVFQGQDVQTGDAAFDDLVRIDGPEVLVRALCTVSVRRLLADWVARFELRVQDRTVRLSIAAKPEETLVKRLRTLRGLLKALVRGEQGAEIRLLRNAGRDPDPAVRAVSLMTLLDGPWTQLDGRRRRRAVRVAASHPGAEVRAAASAPLRTLLAEGDLRLDDLPERALWVLLADGDSAQRLAAAERLGVLGGVDSVAPLTERAGAFFGGGTLKAAARRAIEQIIERSGGLKSGGLSLADDQAGELSLLVDDAEPDLEDG